MQLTTPSFLLRKGTQGKLWLKAVWKKSKIPLVVNHVLRALSQTHIRRLLMLKAVMQYPRKDMLAPNSSTVKTNPNVCAAQKNCHCKTAQMSIALDLSYLSWIFRFFLQSDFWYMVSLHIETARFKSPGHKNELCFFRNTLSTKL